MKHKNSLAFRFDRHGPCLAPCDHWGHDVSYKVPDGCPFSQYLYNSSHMMGQARGMHGMMHGPAETVYLSSVHSSLFGWALAWPC